MYSSHKNVLSLFSILSVSLKTTILFGYVSDLSACPPPPVAALSYRLRLRSIKCAIDVAGKQIMEKSVLSSGSEAKILPFHGPPLHSAPSNQVN